MKRLIDILRTSFSLFWKLLAGVSTIFSLCVSFLPWDNYDNGVHTLIGICFAVFVSVLFLSCLLGFYLYQKHINHVDLKIDGSEINITTGDIFSFGSSCLKVISFNSDFDTHVGDGVIDPNSLNGIYLEKFYKSDSALNDLKLRIREDLHLKENLQDNNPNFLNKGRYKLGSIFKDNDYLLLALTNFDNKNNARVTLNELTDCFLRMWSEIDELKGSNSIVMPLLGSGRTTRIGKKGAELNVTNQELLELLIATFKISRIKIKKPANITIVLQDFILHSRNAEERVDLLKLKEIY